MRTRFFRRHGFGAGLLAGLGGASLAATAATAATVDVSKLPPPSAKPIDFDRDIRPLFERSCFRCHGPEKPKSGFRLDSREAALKGGDNGVAIVPGKSDQSALIHYVARLVSDMEMPPAGKGDPLTTEQVSLLRAWIDQGVVWGATAKAPPYDLDVTTIFGGVGVKGNEAKFREHFWMPQGVNGGIQSLDFTERLPDESRFKAHARILRDDYHISLELTKPKLGSVKFGWEQARKYFSDQGGYHPGLATQSPNLDRALYLDSGRAWFDLTLNRPHWPVMTLGYEYQYRDGEKGMLNWGNTEDPTTTGRSVYPAYKSLREQTHILRFDLDHTWEGWRLQDQFRGEFYHVNSDHQTQLFNLGSGAFEATTLTETASHFHGANALQLEKQLKSWLFASAGYLYSRLRGDSAVGLVGNYYADSGFPLNGNISGYDIVLDRETHMANANFLLGPWEGLSLVAGAQSEWTGQRGFGQQLLNVAPFATTGEIDAVAGNYDKTSVQESVALRFTRIPSTVLFAEARMRQETMDLFQSLAGASYYFVADRDSGVHSDLKDWRAGFSASPVPRVSFGGHFRHRDYADHYTTRLDNGPFYGSAGYPAFIRERETATDEVEGHATFKLASWIRATFTYKWTDSDYWTGTDAEPVTGVPGGGQFSGKQDAHSYSVGASIHPWTRLSLQETATYRHTRTTTEQSDIASVVPYRGNMYSVVSSATYALSPTTDLTGSYNWSRADYGQANIAEGLPLGLDYELHGAQGGVTWRFRKNVTTRLQYGFYHYDEKNTGGFNNYVAHAPRGPRA
ncbi:MAG: hypothetical protein HYR88_01755 [Verrucomicrobia bacterium]|nr:hypothetical protein [Verrucomicrobiota bacterium]